MITLLHFGNATVAAKEVKRGYEHQATTCLKNFFSSSMENLWYVSRCFQDRSARLHGRHPVPVAPVSIGLAKQHPRALNTLCGGDGW